MRRKSKARGQAQLQCMALSGMAYIFLFSIVPMYGFAIAFQNYSFTKGIFGSSYAGLKYFHELAADPDIWLAARNTVMMSLLKLALCFPVAIIFAILLSEVKNQTLRMLTQTASYFPHFISWVVISLMITYWFSSDFGMVNKLLLNLGLIRKPLLILTDPNSFYNLVVFSEMWKETGWSAIIFLAAIAGVDPTYYEAAVMDGATRIQRIYHITLPCIRGAIATVFMLNFASLVNGVGGLFEQSFFLGNALNYESSIIISTYVIKVGIGLGRFSYATAAGLINSTVSLLLLLTCNALSKKLLRQNLYSTGEEI